MKYPTDAYGQAGESVDLGYVVYGATLDRFVNYKYDASGDAHWRPRMTSPETIPHDPESFIYGSRNAAWTLDDIGRVTEIRYFDAWDGIGDPSRLGLAPDRVHRYAYNGGGTEWQTVQKNDNALMDDDFETETKAGSRGDVDGTIPAGAWLEDGLGAGPGGRSAGDGAFGRRREDAHDADAAPPRVSSSGRDRDGMRDIRDAFAWDPAVAFIRGTDGDDTREGTGGADWIDAGRGDDVLTGGAGADAFIFRYGDGTDVITDFQADEDSIRIREDGFDPAHVEATVVALGSGGDPAHPYIPASLHPSGADTTKVTVLTYGGGEEDRLIIVGGTGDADAYRAHFAAYAGDVPDFSGG